MYGARLARPDLLRCVSSLATQLTKWGPMEDERLHRMMSYIQSSVSYRQICFVGDAPNQLSLALFADADFAGDLMDRKSTSGVLLALVGPCTYFPLGFISKKQTAVSTSTPEAELVAAFVALKQEGIPAMDLWELILGRVPVVTMWEDNQAAARMFGTGKAPQLRHVKRMQGVSIAWLHDALESHIFELRDCHTDRQAADIFTKQFSSKERWDKACKLIGITKGTEPWMVGKADQRTHNISIHHLNSVAILKAPSRARSPLQGGIG